MSKGSKRRTEDFNKVQGNWVDIDWTPRIYCDDCMLEINKDNLRKYPDLYVRNIDGTYRHKDCNYN